MFFLNKNVDTPVTNMLKTEQPKWSSFMVVLMHWNIYVAPVVLFEAKLITNAFSLSLH